MRGQLRSAGVAVRANELCVQELQSLGSYRDIGLWIQKHPKSQSRGSRARGDEEGPPGQKGDKGCIKLES